MVFFAYSLSGKNSMLLDISPLSWNRNSIPDSDRPVPPFCVSRSVDERERRDERTQPT